MALGFYMLVPLLAVHLLENLALSVAVVGALTAVRTASQHGLMPVSGWLADRVGARRAICAGVLVRAAGFAMLGIATTTPQLVVACLLTGVGGALFHPASYAAYAVLSGEENRVRVYAVREVLSNLGFVVGPAVGGFLAGVDFQWVGFGAAALFVTAFVLTLVGLPRHLAAKPVEPVRMRSVIGDRPFMTYCLMVAGLWFLLSQLYLLVPFRAAQVLPGPAATGLLYSGAAVLMVLVTIPLTGAVSARLTAGRTLAVGTLALGVGIAVMGAGGTVAGLVVGLAVFTLGQVVTLPTMSAVVASRAPDGAVASYFGVQGVAHAIGATIGSAGGGVLYAYAVSGGWAAEVLPWAVFLVWGMALAALLVRSPIGR
jgi:DHA1 family multidrug resistance protein-like MFS transporter